MISVARIIGLRHALFCSLTDVSKASIQTHISGG